MVVWCAEQSLFEPIKGESRTPNGVFSVCARGVCRSAHVPCLCVLCVGRHDQKPNS